MALNGRDGNVVEKHIGCSPGLRGLEEQGPSLCAKRPGPGLQSDRPLLSPGGRILAAASPGITLRKAVPTSCLHSRLTTARIRPRKDIFSPEEPQILSRLGKAGAGTVNPPMSVHWSAGHHLSPPGY